MNARESRPSPKVETAPEKRLATLPQDSGEQPSPHLTVAEIDASLPTYCLLVKGATGRVSRRLYLSLHSAVKAQRRALDRGQVSTLELVRLVPYTTGRELHSGVSTNA